MERLIKPIRGMNIQNFLEYDTLFTGKDYHLVQNTDKKFELVKNERETSLDKTHPRLISLKITGESVKKEHDSILTEDYNF
jgi:hypothetical protein